MKTFIVLILFLNLCACSKNHPIEQLVELDKLYDNTEHSMHTTVRVLVFLNSASNNGAYKQICNKISSLYGGPNFTQGVCVTVSELPEFELVKSKYKRNVNGGFLVESTDQYSSIWVLDYVDYSAVVLVQRR